MKETLSTTNHPTSTSLHHFSSFDAVLLGDLRHNQSWGLPRTSSRQEAPEITRSRLVKIIDEALKLIDDIEDEEYVDP
jgi:hypothetical protein